MTLQGMKKPLKRIPVFKQLEGESQKRFLNRVNRVTQQVVKRRQYEDKFGVDVTEDERGNVQVKKRKLDEDDAQVLDKKERKRLQRGEEKRLKKRDREKRKRLKKRKDAKEEDFANLKDKVAFNEVASRPPTIKSAGKLEKAKIKAAEMSLARKSALNVERNRVVDAYREVKKRRSMQL